MPTEIHTADISHGQEIQEENASPGLKQNNHHEGSNPNGNSCNPKVNSEISKDKTITKMLIQICHYARR